MTINQALNISKDTAHRSCTNSGSATIPKARIVKMTGSDYLGGDLATSAADRLWGIAVEDISAGLTGSVQTGGVAPVETGGAFSRGDSLTSDSQGRAVEAVEGDSVIGVAAQSSSGAGEFVGCELAYKLQSSGNVQMLEVTITHADLTAAATTETENIGDALPEDARVIGVESELTAVFAGGSVSGVTASLGVSGATTSLINARNVFTGQSLVPLTGDGARTVGTYDESRLIATFTTTGGNAADLTAGSITFRIFYTVQ